MNAPSSPPPNRYAPQAREPEVVICGPADADRSLSIGDIITRADAVRTPQQREARKQAAETIDTFHDGIDHVVDDAEKRRNKNETIEQATVRRRVPDRSVVVDPVTLEPVTLEPPAPAPARTRARERSR